MEPLSVPFNVTSYTSMYDRVITVHGLVATEAHGLVLEYTATENFFGAKPTVDTGIRTLTIPWADVQSIVYRRRYWGWGPGSLVLQTRSLRALDGMPAARGNELTLQVRRADRLAARELAASVELALAEHRLLAFDPPGSRPALDAPASPRPLPPG